jgi:hypothetical protein
MVRKKVEPGKPEITYEDGVPLMPSVYPVLILQGSDYDIGYQYSQQLIQIFGPWYIKKFQRGFTEEERTFLKATQWYVKEYAPEFIEQFKGMADGATDAGVEWSYEEVLAAHCRPPVLEVYPVYHALPPLFPGTEPAESQKMGMPPACGGFVAWGSATKDGKLIAAGGGDGPSISFTLYWRVIILPETGNNYIYAPLGIANYGCHPGMNNKGLVYAHHGDGVGGNEKPGHGIGERLMTQHALRFANNAKEALEMELAYPYGFRPAGLWGGLWADISGDAFDLECRDPLAVRRAGDHGEKDFLYGYNTNFTKSLKPFIGKGYELYKGWPVHYFEHGGFNMDDMMSVRRCLFAWNMLHNYHGEVDPEFAKMMYRMPAPPPDYPTLEEAEIGIQENYGAGWNSYIGSLSNGVGAVMLPDDGDNGLYYAASARTVGRQAQPLTKGDYFFHIAPTNTYYQLKLASNTTDIVMAARQRSQYDLYAAHNELRKLTYADCAYAPLDEIFNKAATESQKGDYYFELARGTKGNESLYNDAKALRAFTRCQAYANQVYEALVPPADNPTDLGLREWFGSWGQWESAKDALSGNPDP